jgi:hypothetical protein
MPEEFTCLAVDATSLMSELLVVTEPGDTIYVTDTGDKYVRVNRHYWEKSSG